MSRDSPCLVSEAIDIKKENWEKESSLGADEERGGMNANRRCGDPKHSSASRSRFVTVTLLLD